MKRSAILSGAPARTSSIHTFGGLAPVWADASPPCKTSSEGIVDAAGVSRSEAAKQAPDHVPLKEVTPRVGERQLGKRPAVGHSRVVRLDTRGVHVRPETSLVSNDSANAARINNLVPLCRIVRANDVNWSLAHGAPIGSQGRNADARREVGDLVARHGGSDLTTTGAEATGPASLAQYLASIHGEPIDPDILSPRYVPK